MPRAALALLIALSTGCAAESFDLIDCKDDQRVGGACAGVPPGPVCHDEYCTQGVSCNAIFHVPTGAAFATAVSSAQPGSCIALTSGEYGSVVLPPGVSLLGRGAGPVTIAGVETSGDGVTVRGLTIEGGSLNVRSGSTTAEMIRIVDSPEDGILAGWGSTLTLRASEIRAFTRYGVSAFEVAALNIDSSIIEGNPERSGPGVWTQCETGCGCTTRPRLSMTNVSIADTTVVGLSVVATEATFENVEVRNTTVGQGYQYGGGVAVSACSSVRAAELRILDNADYGMLIVDSSILADGLRASGNLLGVTIWEIGSSIPASVYLRNAEVRGTRGIGITVAHASTNVTIEDSRVIDTKEIELPVFVNGVQMGTAVVGDGILWEDRSHLVLRRVDVSGSQRQSILIDGGVAPASLIDHVVLSGGDEATGILQQNFVEGNLTPEVIASPPITVTPDDVWPVP